MATILANKPIVQIDADLWEELNNTGNPKFTAEDRVLAVQALYTAGSSLKAEKEIGINASTIRDWKRQSWWEPVRQAIAKFKNENVTGLLIESSLLFATKIYDRAKNGEPVVDKAGMPVMDDEGNPLKRELTLPELTKVFVETHDRARQNLLPGKEIPPKQTTKQQIADFKKAFREAAEEEQKMKLIEGEIVK